MEHVVTKVETAAQTERREAALRAEEAREAAERALSSREGVLRVPLALHSTVLLSVADHFSRAALGLGRRAIGALLGSMDSGTLHLTDSFAVPFEEDSKSPSVYYVDESYLEKMYLMFKKVNAKESVVGWYSTGCEIRVNDINIHETFRPYSPNPIFLLVDVDSRDLKRIPVQCYYSFEEPESDARLRRCFHHVDYTMAATEAEEVGIEHLLKDLQNSFTATTSTSLSDKINALSSFAQVLQDISTYLSTKTDHPPAQRAGGSPALWAGGSATSKALLASFQELYNSIPSKLNLDAHVQDAATKAALATYSAFASKTVITLHALVKNKLKTLEEYKLVTDSRVTDVRV